MTTTALGGFSIDEYKIRYSVEERDRFYDIITYRKLTPDLLLVPCNECSVFEGIFAFATSFLTG